jgi:hypothetical protein
MLIDHDLELTLEFSLLVRVRQNGLCCAIRQCS